MPMFKTGDWVRIPAGTRLLDYLNKDELTKRDVVVQLKENHNSIYHAWYNHLDPAELAEWRRGQWGMDHAQRTLSERRLQKAAADNMGLKSLEVVRWGDGKETFAEYVTAAPAPAPRKVTPPKINLRQQMVPKSRWKITADADITAEITNPQLEMDLRAWLVVNPHPRQPPQKTVMYGGRPAIVMPSNNDPVWAAYYTAEEAHRKAQSAERARIAKLYPANISYVIRSVKTGEAFEVQGKFTTYARVGSDYLHGQFVKVKFDGETKDVTVSYSGVKDVIVAESIPTVDIYVLRDKATGLFLKSYPCGNTTYEWDKDENGENLLDARGNFAGGHYVYNGMGNKPEMVDAFMKAKHFDNMGKVKTSILGQTGYYEGLNTEALDNSRGYDTSYEKQMDLPDTWEVVKFDKLARKEVDTLDIQTWYKRAWELRELTLRFGSSVRAVYKDLEKREELDKYKGLLVFNATDAQVEDKMDWGATTALTATDLEEIDTVLTAAGLTKKSFRKAKDHRSVSVTFPNKGAALLVKLSYSGGLKVSVLDLETLTEAVES
jgi:hypothetical protein